MDSRPVKRVKLDSDSNTSNGLPGNSDAASIRAKRTAFLNSISRSVSPPGISRSGTNTPTPKIDALPSRQDEAITRVSPAQNDQSESSHDSTSSKPASRVKCIPSPFKLTSIRDLPSSQNNDTVSLHDILGNPLIKEAWIFNFCFDVDWLMTFFDPDVRSQVKVKVVHGSWKRDSENRIAIENACTRWPNVESLTAYLPDPFGTHHSKMFVLFTHDDSAQVVIHTANMLHQDWTNMTQAAWQSPFLPKLKDKLQTSIGNIGSGSRFKYDLLAYLEAYGSKTRAVREQLSDFDFTSVRGALVASVPSRMNDFSIAKGVDELSSQKLWGYPSLFRALKAISAQQAEHPKRSHVVCQVSSIATLPMTWLDQFFPTLSQKPSAQMWNSISIIYPTPSNVATSLDGYSSGGSIHTKAQSAAHLKQVTTLRRTLCKWTQGPKEECRAGRHQAAPHIKTYVSFAEKPTANLRPDVNWALLTSANLSTQAWGTLRGKEKEVVVQSFEIGVLVWPELFAEDFDTSEQEDNSSRDTKSGDKVRMVPVFGSDTPHAVEDSNHTSTLVGLRLPYDLPLTPYANGDMPWSPQGTYDTPDRHGRRWARDFRG
ncbi:putative tyrosyl-DNA phosphodiesterase [Exophiala viscosa]|uniref:Tyrosyl-DNA phosphodiesterase n=1 Tax=Exophiala viscosa TaxID=2486360 RepID=A0AAN6DYJ5_9EURO|nr:putative tyrosyl-DNA phosphodiesterase [Exophiala viscosa]